MGQYFYVVNLDKKEYLHPLDLDDGLKMGDFSNTLDLLSYLLSDSKGYVNSAEASQWQGRWKGDRIVVAGDYSAMPPETFLSDVKEGDSDNLHNYANAKFDRISHNQSLIKFSLQIQDS